MPSPIGNLAEPTDSSEGFKHSSTVWFKNALPVPAETLPLISSLNTYIQIQWQTVTAAGFAHSDSAYPEVLKQHTRLSKVLPKNEEPNLFFISYTLLHSITAQNNCRTSSFSHLTIPPDPSCNSPVSFPSIHILPCYLQGLCVTLSRKAAVTLTPV